MNDSKEMTVNEEVIVEKIYLIRGIMVMLDSDLASLHGVSTRNLNKAVKRNILRFPDDCMLRLSGKEFNDLMFQIVTSK